MIRHVQCDVKEFVNMLERDTVSNVYRDVCNLVSQTSRYFNRYDKSFVTIRIKKKKYGKCYLNEPYDIQMG